MKEYFVYILTNNSGTLYIGVTNDLFRRVQEHKSRIANGFTQKYHIDKLIYFESYPEIVNALNREKQLKNWHSEWKLNLIKKLNPELREIQLN